MKQLTQQVVSLWVFLYGSNQINLTLWDIDGLLREIYAGKLGWEKRCDSR